MNTINEISRMRGKVDERLVIGIVTAAVVILAAIWLFTGTGDDPEPIPEPGGRELDTVAPAETAAERGDSARELIEELQSGEGEVDYGRAYERAQAFREEGRAADAQLLYFFAARGGHADAAFALAQLYDPTRESNQNASGDPQAAGLAGEPDAFQAYRWYDAAAEAGHPQAGERLSELRNWAEQAAAAGDAEAERLLLQWE